MAYPNSQSNPAGAIPVWMVSSPPGGAGNGISANGSVGTSSATLIAASTFSAWVTIQNRHASQTLYVSFNNPATANDFAIAPGGALTLQFAFGNILYGLGSGAATTYALIGM